ncbi:MAG: hypothetical protein KUG74_10835 [Rhodobacteraceae bacterium]|nr:hypothetical protein [Paracoccaceae bacterium]
MSTRSTITVADKHDSFDIYQHHDGYPDGPHGLVRHIAMARRLAWDLPRFEAADFAAAILAVLKDRGGSTYLTKDADLHGDRDYHYQIAPLRENFHTRVMLTISRPSWEKGKPDTEVFSGEIQKAVQQFDSVPETSGQPREWQMLGEIEGALYRAEEEISQWIKGTPDPDTQSVLDDLDDAGRAMCQLRHHLEKANPWDALKKAETILENTESSPANRYVGIARTEIRLAIEAHHRFQRDK